MNICPNCGTHINDNVGTSAAASENTMQAGVHIPRNRDHDEDKPYEVRATESLCAMRDHYQREAENLHRVCCEHELEIVNLKDIIIRLAARQ